MRYSLAILALLTVSVAPLAAHADTVSFTFTTSAGGNFGGSIFGEPISITGTFDSGAVTDTAGTFSAPTTFTFILNGQSAVDHTPGGNFLTVDPSTDTAELVGASGLFVSLNSSDLSGLTGLTPGFTVSGTGTPGNNFESFDINGGTIGVELESINDAPTLVVGNPATGPSAVPEPSSLLFLSTGLMGLAGTARRRFARR